MVFVGVSNPPAGTWPSSVYTTITNTPLIAEKPYLYLDSNGNYVVMVPALQTNSLGTTWAAGPTPGVSIPISQFYVAQPGLGQCRNHQCRPELGAESDLDSRGLSADRQPARDAAGHDRPGAGLSRRWFRQTGTPALVISDVDGVKVAGLIFDAGPVQSPSLLQVGTADQLPGSFA